MFDDLLQTCRQRWCSWRVSCKAFTRARKIKPPVQLLQMVFLYSGLDTSRRDVAGERTLRVERSADAAVRARLGGLWSVGAALLARLVQATGRPRRPRDGAFW